MITRHWVHDRTYQVPLLVFTILFAGFGVTAATLTGIWAFIPAYIAVGAATATAPWLAIHGLWDGNR